MVRFHTPNVDPLQYPRAQRSGDVAINVDALDGKGSVPSRAQLGRRIDLFEHLFTLFIVEGSASRVCAQQIAVDTSLPTAAHGHKINHQGNVQQHITVEGKRTR